jgi:hypothetical protein
MLQEEFEDTKVVIRIRKSKDRHSMFNLIASTFIFTLGCNQHKIISQVVYSLETSDF